MLQTEQLGARTGIRASVHMTSVRARPDSCPLSLVPLLRGVVPLVSGLRVLEHPLSPCSFLSPGNQAFLPATADSREAGHLPASRLAAPFRKARGILTPLTHASLPPALHRIVTPFFFHGAEIVLGAQVLC